MAMSSAIENPKILIAVQLLQEKFPQLVFGKIESLAVDEVRLCFAGYDEENGTFRPYAGLIATRRQWSRQPEPTLILGFESNVFLRLSEEAGIIEQPGVKYVLYSADLKQIQKAIDEVLEVLQPSLSEQVSLLNEKDLLDWIAQFRHRFKTDIGSLRFRYDKLVSREPLTTEKQYGFLAAMRKDYIFKEKERYQKELKKISGPAVAKHHRALCHIEDCLNRADQEWQDLHTHVKMSFSVKASDVATTLLHALIITLVEMYDSAREMRDKSK